VYLPEGVLWGNVEVPRTVQRKGTGDLTLAVITINTWNRLAISSRSTVGTYQVKTPETGGRDTPGKVRGHVLTAKQVRPSFIDFPRLQEKETLR
jgi:hypothetical protein